MDWFKMQTVWGASVERFSDAEAGRFIKALYAYVRDGVEYEGGSGREEPLIFQALETLRGDIESFKRNEANQKAQEEAKREKRRQAAKARWAMQNDANASKCNAENANASACTICNANASENKNKNQNKKDIKENPLKGVKEKPLTRFTPPTVEEITAYCQERGNSVNAQRFHDFYAAKGWKVGNQPMKDWKAAVRTWEQRDGNAAPAKVVSAQQYGQRHYTEGELLAVSDDLLAEARKARETA